MSATVGSGAAVLLAPGAGSDRDQPSLVLIEQLLAPIPVVRMDFPYRKAGRKVPDKASVLLGAVAEEVAAMGAGRLVLGGRSMGGRMCSMAVAAGLPAVGLVLISYPLHPPGRPDRLRTEHFPLITVPCLFISGTRDSFASREELEEHTALIPGDVVHVWLDGGDHGLRRKDQMVAETAAGWIRSVL